jgi:hypothetical protein
MDKRGGCLTVSSKYIVAILVVHIVELIVVAGVWYGLDFQARTALSHRLGIGNQGYDFTEYVLANFKPGMTRRQVIEQGDIIGTYSMKPYFIENKYCEKWVFNVGPFDTMVGLPWSICYDENGIVISMKGLGNQ